MIRNALSGMNLPVYGKGENVRDWLYVRDHCTAIDLVFHKGDAGKTYNVGGHNEVRNIDLVTNLCRILDDEVGGGPREELITFVKDRPGHDMRYAIDASFIADTLGWNPEHNFDDGLRETIRWYLANDEWLQNCVSGDYRKYYETMYGNR